LSSERSRKIGRINSEGLSVARTMLTSKSVQRDLLPSSMDLMRKQQHQRKPRPSKARPEIPPGPVPIKFRTPSTSLMMRETSAPVLF